ncbi:PREDICTED: uncharacterized protein LOC106541486 [Thamnophis sirtalis]|uniref:Uncharacterized protein LOC106541486 n=1 Tax=Thamnophis sirtalis TaxID=35019 RepID=A0A6I9XEY4_9SAUR|nr:PREDICTED: uncharacterized protein LOC106541486 [Thamnophis sirtalis]
MLEQALQRYGNDSKHCGIEMLASKTALMKINVIRMLKNSNAATVDDGTGKGYGCDFTMVWLSNVYVKSASVPYHWKNGIIVPLANLSRAQRIPQAPFKNLKYSRWTERNAERESESRELFSARHFLARAKRGENRQSFNLHRGAIARDEEKPESCRKETCYFPNSVASYLVIRFNIIDKVNDLSMKNKDILLHQFPNTRLNSRTVFLKHKTGYSCWMKTKENDLINVHRAAAQYSIEARTKKSTLIK